MVHIFPASKLQFSSPAASFCCGVWEQMKAFFFPWSRSAAWRNGLCGTTSSQNWTECSAHLSISLSKPVVVRPLICCNLLPQPQCQDKSYFRIHSRLSSVASQNFKDTREDRRSEKDRKRNVKNQKMTKERSEGLVPFVLSFIASGLGDLGKLLWTVVYTIWFPCLVSDTNSTERDGWIWRYISACVFSFSVLTYQFVRWQRSMFENIVSILKVAGLGFHES